MDYPDNTIGGTVTLDEHPDQAQDDCDYDGEDQLCHQCGGDGWGIVGVDWDSDDPINGPYVGEIEPCPCCGGSGKAEDCTYW